MSKESALNLPFSAGIDESQRIELLDPTAAFPIRENLRQRVLGGANKRYGFAAQTLARADGGNRSAAYKLFAHGQSACVIDGTSLDVYSPTGTKNWRIGRAPEIGVRRIPATTASFSYSGSSNYETVDLAYANGYYAVCVLEEIQSSGSTVTRIVVTVLERATGAVVRSFRHTADVTNSGFQCCTVGNTLVVVYSEPATAHLVSFTLDLTSPTTIYSGLVAVGTIVTDRTSNDDDFAIVGMATKYAIAYANNSGGTSGLSVKTFLPSATSASNSHTSLTTGGAVKSVAIDGSESDIIYVAWSRSANQNIHVLGYNSSLTVTSTDATIIAATANGPKRLGIKRLSATTGVVTGLVRGMVAADTGWGATVARPFQTSGGATSATGAAVYNYGWVPWSPPVTLGGRVYVPATFGPDSNLTQVVHNTGVFDMTAGTTMVGARPVAMPAVGLAPGSVDAHLSSHWHHSVQVSSTVAAYPQPVLMNGSDTAVHIVELDIGDARRWQPATHANGITYLSAGMLYGFDGKQLFEAGFAQPPAIAVADSGSAGNPNGAYNYVAIFEWSDAQGNVYWSEPSNIATVTVASKSVTVTALSLTATWKDGADDDATMSSPNNARRVRVRVYRTVASGSIYYFVGYILNDPTKDSGTLTDNLTDAAVSAKAQMYTQPGTQGTALARKCPPAAAAICPYQDMLAVLADDGQSVWITAQQVIGEGAWWSPVFQYPVVKGATAIAAMDGTLFVFTRTAVWAIAGESPSDNGSSGGLGAPRRISSDVGCIDPRSLCVTVLGVFFQSERGIELLNRGGGIDWIGQPIQETTAAYPVCTAATLDVGEAVVYFELAAAETNHQVSGSGRTAVYDLTTRSWVSTDRRKNNAGTADVPAQSGAYVYDGTNYRYAWLGTDGRVYVEDQTTHLDPGSRWVTAKVSTSWIHTAGHQGEQSVDRVIVLGDKRTSHDLQRDVYFDYVDAAPESVTFTAAQIDALERLLLDRELVQSTSTAIRVILSDVTPSSGSVGTGQGATWIGLAFPGIAHRGVNRTSSVQRGV